MKVGMIVPSSNVTMEIEVPSYLPYHNLSIHSTRVKMNKVTPEELLKMNEQVIQATDLLLDAHVDVIASACLVATMMAPGGHLGVETRMQEVVQSLEYDTPTITSAGALIRSIHKMGWQKVAMVCPYSDELTAKVISYLSDYDIDVVDHRNYGITNNFLVSRIGAHNIIQSAKEMSSSSFDGLIASACVQMPSLEAMHILGKTMPVMSAAYATAMEIELCYPE